MSLLESIFGDAVGNVADLRDLGQTNPDGDYLPGVMLKEGELGLVENAQKSYAPIGLPFTAYSEIRGFETGLNATDDFLKELTAEKADTKLKAGTFTIPAGSTMQEIIAILIK